MNSNTSGIRISAKLSVRWIGMTPNVLITASLLSVLLVTGCGVDNVGEKMFRESCDFAVGWPIEGWTNEPHVVRDVGGGLGMKEYEFKRPNGCSWSFVTDSNSIVLSWRYLSDPSLCTTKFRLGPF